MRRRLILMMALFLALVPNQIAPVAAETSLDLTPWRGSCTTPIVAQGTEFAPGSRLRFTARREDADEVSAIAIGEATVAADGTVSLMINLAKLFPDCAASAAAAGLQYRFSARDADTGALLAYAIFGVNPNAAPGATLILAPESGPCPTVDPQVAVRGTGFPAGVTVEIDVRDQAGAATTFSAGVVAANGTFTAPIKLVGCGPNTPVGTVFTLLAYSSDIPGAEPQTLLAVTTFTVATPVAQEVCFSQTGKCIKGRFLQHWIATGGLAINGYPLSGEIQERLEDNKTYTVQYFERVRMEAHPENQPPFDVLLGQFGRRILAGVAGAPTAPVAPRDGAAFFAETGHNVDADLVAFWATNGGLAQFGYPLTEEFVQRLEDGKLYVVQYFERARIERHPENAAPNNIQLGQFGRQICGVACR